MVIPLEGKGVMDMELWLMLLVSILSLVVAVINLTTAIVTAKNTQQEKKKELPPRKK